MLESASIANLQNFLSLAYFLQKSKVSDWISFVEEELKSRDREQAIRKEYLINETKRVQDLFLARAPKCPKCGAVPWLRSIEHFSKKQNLKGFKSHWFCMQENCDFEKYSYKSLDEHFAELEIVTELFQ